MGVLLVHSFTHLFHAGTGDGAAMGAEAMVGADVGLPLAQVAHAGEGVKVGDGFFAVVLGVVVEASGRPNVHHFFPVLVEEVVEGLRYEVGVLEKRLIHKARRTLEIEPSGEAGECERLALHGEKWRVGGAGELHEVAQIIANSPLPWQAKGGGFFGQVFSPKDELEEVGSYGDIPVDWLLGRSVGAMIS